MDLPLVDDLRRLTFFELPLKHLLTPFASSSEYYPQNIMYDKRVFRGRTNAAMVLPAGNYPDTLFDNRKERAKAKAQARAAAAEEFFTRDVRTPEPLQGRQNIDI